MLKFRPEGVQPQKVQTFQIFIRLRQLTNDYDIKILKKASIKATLNIEGLNGIYDLEKEIDYLDELMVEDGMVFSLWDVDLLKYLNLEKLIEEKEFEELKSWDKREIETEREDAEFHNLVDTIEEKLESVKLPVNWFINAEDGYVSKLDLNYTLKPDITFIHFLGLLLQPNANVRHFLDYNLDYFLRYSSIEHHFPHYDPKIREQYFKNLGSKKHLFLDELETILIKLKKDNKLQKDLYEFTRDWVDEKRKMSNNNELNYSQESDKDNENKDFEVLLTEKGKNILPYLSKKFWEAEPRFIAAMLFALYDLNLMGYYPEYLSKKQLHMYLTTSFGNYGDKSSLKKAIERMDAPDDKNRNEIERIKNYINSI